MVKSTRVSFQVRFIHRLYVGAGTLPRVIFTTRYIHPTHLAPKDSAWAHVPQAVRVCPCGMSLLAPAGQGAESLPFTAESLEKFPSPSPMHQHPHWGAQPLLHTPTWGVGTCARCPRSRRPWPGLCRDSTAVAVVDKEVSHCQT